MLTIQNLILKNSLIKYLQLLLENTRLKTVYKR